MPISKQLENLLYPESSPFVPPQHLAVDEIHTVYFEEHGKVDEKSIPLIWFHGGPGGNITPLSARYMNPLTYYSVLWDQLGCGKSTPFGEVKNNTTNNQVKATVKILDSLGIEKAVFVGHSWGTTLSCCVAIQHPDRVLGMVLRGVFLGNMKDTAYYMGGGTGMHHPEAWERFLRPVPPEQDHFPLAWYYEQLRQTDPDGREERARLAYELHLFETACSRLEYKPLDEVEKELAEEKNGANAETIGLMEAHYITQGCFLPEDYILDHADRIPEVPIEIVHGRHDHICMPESAWRLHNRLGNKSRLHFTHAGHALSDLETAQKVIQVTDRLPMRLKEFGLI